MNKISRLGAYVLGAAIGSGCTTTINQSDLYNMLAEDNKIDNSDYRAFCRAEETLKERVASASGEEKTEAEALLGDVRKILNKYENQANANARVRAQPVFDFFAPNGELMNLNGTSDSGAYVEFTLEGLARAVGNPVVALDILRKATPTWESTHGKRSNAERIIYRTSVENLNGWFGSDARVAELLSVAKAGSGYTVLPGTAGVRAIVNYGVDVTAADLEALTNLRPAEPAESAEEEEAEQPKSN